LSHDFVKATRWASRAGVAFAWLLIALGLLDLFVGNWVQGVWLMLIGWFLQNAARASYTQVLVRSALTDVPVSRLMRTRFGHVAPDLSLADFVRDCLMTSEQRAWPVEVNGVLLGLVVWNDARRVPQAEWPLTPVSEVMTPRDRLAAVAPDAAADGVLETFTRHDVDQIPVVEGNRIVGLIRRADLLAWFALQQQVQPTSYCHRRAPCSTKRSGVAPPIRRSAVLYT
jgi:hypothetical protein